MNRWRTTRRGWVGRFGSNLKGCIAHGEVTIASSTESTQRGIASRSWPSSTDRTLTGRVSQVVVARPEGAELICRQVLSRTEEHLGTEHQRAVEDATDP